MPKFYILDKQACEVTWRFPVEADTEEEAYAKYAAGDHGPAEGEPEIGDSIDAIQYDVGIERGES